MLHHDSSEEFIARVKSIEHRSDQCIDHFALLGTPKHVARWTVLTAVIHTIEDNHNRFGPDSPEFRAAMVNLARHAPMLIRWLDRGEKTPVPKDWNPYWESFVGGQAFRDLRIVLNYDAFLNSFPMWHRNRLHAELLGNDVVRFRTPPDSRDRQVSAFQKGLRRQAGEHRPVPAGRIEPTDAILRRYKRILDSAIPVGIRGFSYEHPDELLGRTFRKYVQRMETIMKRSEKLTLGPYTLGTFKRLYAVLQGICAIHEFLCFLWGQRTGTYPIESALLVKSRVEWIELMSLHSGVDRSMSEELLNDLTFYSRRLPDLHVFPFVPLDDEREMLALVPQFLLNSSPEGNILRTCSYLREKFYNLLSDDKAALMRDDLLSAFARFKCDHSIPLPDGSTDIDLLIEDEPSSTVVIAELKWYRKPSTYRERLRADEDFDDGFDRQLKTIRNYCENNPKWLNDRGLIKRSLKDYENIFYLLIGRDHWKWFDPRESSAVVEFEQARLFATRNSRLCDVVLELLRYDWLPIEGEDFHVRYDRAIVEGVGIESEVYYGGQNPR